VLSETRNGPVAMQYLKPGWTFDNKRPCLARHAAAANSFERLMLIRHSASQSRNDDQRANDFCARALEFAGD
jgi:hypothetical protein